MKGAHEGLLDAMKRERGQVCLDLQCFSSKIDISLTVTRLRLRGWDPFLWTDLLRSVLSLSVNLNRYATKVALHINLPVQSLVNHYFSQTFEGHFSTKKSERKSPRGWGIAKCREFEKKNPLKSCRVLHLYRYDDCTADVDSRVWLVSTRTYIDFAVPFV